MPRAYSSDPIPSFPADIDRTAFGHWLSGFVDGEGCFRLVSQSYPNRISPTFKASFTICLRDDDQTVLGLIRSFLGCGQIYLSAPPSGLTRNSKPRASFTVSPLPHHMEIIIPHFRRFPLLAKKSRDFEVWVRGVELIHRVSLRPRVSLGGKGGSLPKWLAEERAEFLGLIATLTHLREYSAD